MPQRRTFTNNSMEISYLQWSDRGRPLLLLHGMADHALVWSSLGDYLSSNYGSSGIVMQIINLK